MTRLVTHRQNSENFFSWQAGDSTMANPAERPDAWSAGPSFRRDGRSARHLRLPGTRRAEPAARRRLVARVRRAVFAAHAHLARRPLEPGPVPAPGHPHRGPRRPVPDLPAGRLSSVWTGLRRSAIVSRSTTRPTRATARSARWSSGTTPKETRTRSDAHESPSFRGARLEQSKAALIDAGES